MKYLTKDTAKKPLQVEEKLEANEARRIYSKVRKDFEVVKKKVQMENNEMFNWNLSPNI